MFIRYRTQGVIVKKRDLGEADQLFTVFTKNFGKLEVLGKAIRKIKSKLRGGADLFYLSEIEFIQGKTCKTLTDTILIENFSDIRKDLQRLANAYQIAEALDSLVVREEEDDQIWQLLLETFEKLNTKYKIQNTTYLVYYYFLWNLLSVLGYRPELYNCSVCQKKLRPEKLYFNPKKGGVICQDCFPKNKLSKDTEPETVKVLRIILEKNWQILSKLKISFLLQKSLKNISQYYLDYILGEIK